MYICLYARKYVDLYAYVYLYERLRLYVCVCMYVRIDERMYIIIHEFVCLYI